jgi:pimeloyl-ACP methyl ester carboxylesterase
VSISSTAGQLTTEDVLDDLEAGRSRPLHTTGDHRWSLPTVARPTMGGGSFLRTYLTTKALGRLHPRLARRGLMRLWFTPWVHPSALEPVDDLPVGLGPWSLVAGGRTLRGYAGGTGPTVLLVHGWAGRAADWRHVVARLLAAGWRVVAPDLPAHGTSPGRETDLFQLGGALAAVLDHERPHAVIAHSMGFPTTLVAVEAGAFAPHTLVAIAPGRKMARVLEAFGRRSRLGPALREQLRAALEDRFGADLWNVLDVDRVLPGLAIHGLVIHDRDDDEVPLHDGEQIAARWPGSRFVVTEGLGHRRILRDEGVHQVVAEALERTTKPPDRGRGASRGGGDRV